jgi:hypothetical protein
MRVTRRLAPSHMISLPCRSRVQPLPSPVCSRITCTPAAASQRSSRLLCMSTHVKYPSGCQSGPSVAPRSVASNNGSVDSRIAAKPSVIRQPPFYGCLLGHSDGPRMPPPWVASCRAACHGEICRKRSRAVVHQPPRAEDIVAAQLCCRRTDAGRHYTARCIGDGGRPSILTPRRTTCRIIR